MLSPAKSLEVARVNPPDAVVILGGGKPKSLLEPPRFVQNRCDIAAKIYLEAKKFGRKIHLVPISAGTAHSSQLLNKQGLPIWESAASAAYMVKTHGIDSKAILMETTSYDTIGNAYFTRAQICDPMDFKRIWIVTSEFHMPRSKAIFEWIFNCTGPKKDYELTFISTENVGLSENDVKTRKEREARSLKNVEKLSKQHTTMKDVMLFLLTDHRMYSVDGLDTHEDVSEELRNSYKA